MKKLIKNTILTLLLGVAFSMSAFGRIAVIDSEKLWNDLGIAKQIDEEFAGEKGKLDFRQKALEKLSKQYSNEAITADSYEKINMSEKLSNERALLENQRRAFKAKVELSQAEHQRQLLIDIHKVLPSIMKKSKYDKVIDKKLFIYVAENSDADISVQVINKIRDKRKKK